MMEYLVLAGIGYIAALTPGPDIFYVIRQGLCSGLKSALVAVAGILTGNIFYLTLVYLGLGTIGESLIFQAIVGAIGAIYLLRIAFLIYNDKPHLQKECILTKNIYKEALFLNLSNPKAMLFFAIVVTPFIGKNIMLSFLALFLGIALAFVTGAIVSSKLNLTDNMLIIINKIAAFVFLFFSIKLFLISIDSFLKLFPKVFS